MEKKFISDYLKIAASKYGDRDFLICNDRTLSWSEAYEESNFVASFIAQQLKSRQQKIIGILLPDSWQFVVSYFGVVTSGNVAMPLDITFKKLELDYLASAIKPEFVIVNRQTQHLIDGPAVLIEDILLNKSTFALPSYGLPPGEQIATLFFSSGTTGKPKPIPNTHTNQIWDVSALSSPMGWTEKDSLLITLHLAHRHGLVICLLGAVYHGNKVYLEERFNAHKALQILSSGKVSLYSAVPTIFSKLIEEGANQKFDLSVVRLFASSSSALSPALQREFKVRYGHTILDRYGTSETGSIAIKNGDGDETFGELLDGVQIRLEKGGEVALKSPGLFPGYFNNAGATKKNMTPDGWWLTGDIGELKRGKLILKGRTKEKISKAGYSIFPQDIEWGLHQAPGVEEVKVIGLPNSSDEYIAQDKVVAFFTGSAPEGQVKQFSSLNLPRSWRPDVFVKLEKIPKTANGKPRLAELKSLGEKSI
ncbi:MAG TPA: class I adenylate-forming enzyme family protein [Candidatus Saccharimonadales bacterium]|nr:class I adenylate-forming enzyme family protein [Candidatus Saccharimonadales bacterium]